MFARLRFLTLVLVFPSIFLLVFGLTPVAVSAMYGGKPPEHMARLLDKQMDTFARIAEMVFAPLGPAPKSDNKLANSER